MAKASVTQPLISVSDEQKALEIYNALNQNQDQFSQKIKVLKLKHQPGNERKDKDGNVLVNEFGEPVRWDDSYHLTYVALNSGGEHTTRITQSQYLSLKENEIYIASGKVDYRLYKDSFNSVPVVVFNSFALASELFVTTALKFGLFNNSPEA